MYCTLLTSQVLSVLFQTIAGKTEVLHTLISVYSTISGKVTFEVTTED